MDWLLLVVSVLADCWLLTVGCRLLVVVVVVVVAVVAVVVDSDALQDPTTNPLFTLQAHSRKRLRTSAPSP